MKNTVLMILLTGALLTFAACTNGTGPMGTADSATQFSQESPQETNLPLESITLPPGFKIGVFAEHLPGARSMTRASDGTIFVGTRDAGNVYALRDLNHDMYAETVNTILQQRNMPNGVAMIGADLYVAEANQIIKLPSILKHLNNPPQIQTILNGLPKDFTHGWKYLAQGPDKKLYFGIGAPCNACVKEDPLYATISRVNTDGSEFEVFASGIRNTVGFDWHPKTGELWFTENGRDLMGDNSPPDELNHAPKKGLHFGFPYIYGEDVEDPTWFSKKPADLEVTPSVQELGPHVAALGMKFYHGNHFPAEYQNQIFMAEHGSWNRADPIGYRISVVRFSDNGETSYETFASGWLNSKGKAWGRPVDVMVLPDGTLLISDDVAGAIYRIWYEASS